MGTPRALKGLLSVALLSNAGTAGLEVVLLWHLSSDSSTHMYFIPVVSMIPVASVTGTTLGGYLARTLGLNRAIVIGIALEALMALTAIIWSICSESLDRGISSMFLATTIVGLFFSASVAGPAWIKIISDWGDSEANRTQFVGLDSSQYQAGRTGGFLIGGLLSPLDALAGLSVGAFKLLCALALLAFLMGLILSTRGPQGKLGEEVARGYDPGSCRRPWSWWPGSTAVILALLLAGIADPARAYLPLALSEGGNTGLVFGISATLFGFGGLCGGLASSTVFAGRMRRWSIPFGFCSVAVGLLLWSIAGEIPLVWFCGSIIAGFGGVLVTNRMMVLASSRASLGADAVTTVIVVRTGAAAVASPAVGILMVTNEPALAYYCGSVLSLIACFVFLVTSYTSRRD
ncbi:MFS transporter [Nesterenkonia suensis]